MLKLWPIWLILLACVGCAPSPSAGKGGKINAVSTVGMIHDAVRIVGGDKVESIALMGPGIDPHLYRATAGDVQKLDKADLIFYCGLELEGRMTEIFEKMRSRKPTHAVGEAVPKGDLREPPEFKGKYDPHIWFDVTMWKHVVNAVRDALSKQSPENATYFEENAAAYQKKLDELHGFVTSESAKVPKERRVLVTAHDAFGYFGQRYGFEVLGIQGTSTATEAGGGSIRRIADVIAQRKVKAIFVESSVPPSTIEALQKAVQSRGWNVTIGGKLFSDAMGESGTAEGTYEGMVKHNVTTIVKALQ